MSIDVKRIMSKSPKDLSVFKTYAGLIAGPFIEASPIYSTYKIDYSILGSYTSGSIDTDLNYSGTKTWTRINLNSALTPAIVIPTDGILLDNEILKAIMFYTGSLASNEMYFGLEPSFIINDYEDVLYSPQHPAASIILGGDTELETAAIIGTITDNGPSPAVVTDYNADIMLLIPSFYFAGAIVMGERKLLDTFYVGGIQYGGFTQVSSVIENVSSWGFATWRDFRGVYTNTDIDSNGVSLTVTITIS